MQKQEQALKFLKQPERCRRIAVLGIGSELRADDAAGVLVVRELGHMIKERPFRNLQFQGFEGGNAPENTTGFISRFKPTHILVVDAADIAVKTGECRTIDPREISEIAFSTHTLPMKIVTDYLEQATGAEIAIIGIQPGNLDFGKCPTAAVLRGVRQLSGRLYQFMRECDRSLGESASGESIPRGE